MAESGGELSKVESTIVVFVDRFQPAVFVFRGTQRFEIVLFEDHAIVVIALNDHNIVEKNRRTAASPARLILKRAKAFVH